MEKQTCCHIGCDKVAEFMITGPRGEGYDDTYMCNSHVLEHVGENDTVQVTLEQALAILYSLEINCKIESYWDAGYTLRIGNELSGYRATSVGVELDEIAGELLRLAKLAYSDLEVNP